MKEKLEDVHCAACNREQPDEGKGKSCDFCGCSPLPSFSYAKTSAFYPKPLKEQPEKKTLKQLMREIKSRRTIDG